MDQCPHGDSAEPQQGCVCRAQLRAGLTHEGRFPLQQHQPQLWQPWDEAQSQVTQREHRRARPWGQVSTEQLCPNPRLTASGRGAGGSTPEGCMYTSPVPCLQGWEMWVPREALLPRQHQPMTQLCVKCLAQLTRGTWRRQLRQLFPAPRANIPIKWPTKYFLSFL